MNTDPRALMAAHNNADLYEAVFKAQGCRFDRLDFAFVARDVPPPFYSNLTVLAPDRTAEILDHLAHLRNTFSEKLSFKDSFCTITPMPQGFRRLFRAEWIWKAPQSATLPSGWAPVTAREDLRQWEQAWKAGGSQTQKRMFPDSFLDQPGIHVFAEQTDGRVTAGCIVNASSDCVGLSNVFSTLPGAQVFEQATACAHCVDPAKPVVGYEWDDALTSARAIGFEAVGSLQVMLGTD